MQPMKQDPRFELKHHLPQPRPANHQLHHPSCPSLQPHHHQPNTTPAAMPASRESTPDSPLGSTPDAPQSPPPPTQSEEATPIHILQLRNQLQRIEARQLQMQAETKVFQQNLIAFLCFQFPATATHFNAQPEATTAVNRSIATQPIPSANPSAKAGNTEELQFSSDNQNDVFDWQSPREHLQPLGPTPSKPAEVVPILSAAPTPATSAISERPTPDSPARRKGKATADKLHPARRRKSQCSDLPSDRGDTTSSLLIVMMTAALAYQSPSQKNLLIPLSLLLFNFCICQLFSHPKSFCQHTLRTMHPLSLGEHLSAFCL
ncbi:hypothetical protein V6N13_036955 [Hibiscus sabdariffa]